MQGAGLEDIVRTRSERISELRACIAEVQSRMEHEPGTEHTLRQPLEATYRKLAFHERHYPCLVRQLRVSLLICCTTSVHACGTCVDVWVSSKGRAANDSVAQHLQAVTVMCHKCYDSLLQFVY